jgi:hypothetical protein
MLPSLPMQHGGHSIVLRGLYALQLQPWLESFPNQVKVLSINEIKGPKSQVHFFLSPLCCWCWFSYLLSLSPLPPSLPPPQIQQTLNDVFEFISLPPSDIEDVNPKNSRSYSEMSPQVTPPSLIRLLLL